MSEPLMYMPHDHGYGRHSHAVGQRHMGDVNNPRATDHAGVEEVPQADWHRRVYAIDPYDHDSEAPFDDD